MKKLQPIIKTIIIAIIVAGFSYIGLAIDKSTVEDVVDSYVVPAIESDAAKNTVVLQSISGTVTHVIDGDTFIFESGGEEQTVRVLGIDTPETAFSPRGAECFGAEATSFAVELLESKTVSISADPTQAATDQYDRVIAYVALPDGSDFGERMLAAGHAREFTYAAPYKKQTTYQRAEAEAKAVGFGLWSCQS